MINTKPEKPKVLYVDDTEANLILFEHTFKNDYEIFLADSGEKGLELLRTHKFVVLVSDQRMPGMSGNELLETAALEFPEVMRFLLTAYSDYETLVEAINIGQIYGFFNKPFKAHEVRMVLNRAIEVYYLREKNLQMMKELAAANKDLHTIDTTKTKFLSSITEEIKAPISKITSAIHMLKDKIDSKDLNELLNYLDSSINRLENFTSMANQLALLREGQNNLTYTDVSLKELVEISFIEKNTDLKDKEINISLVEKEEGLMVKGDFDLLLTCMSIVLANSVKYSKTNASILITLERKNNITYCNVTTTVNSHAQQLENLINYFSPDSKSPDTEAGIELVLARQIMEAHAGVISIGKEPSDKVSVNMIFRPQAVN